jgi:hypothetical protein
MHPTWNDAKFDWSTYERWKDKANPTWRYWAPKCGYINVSRQMSWGFAARVSNVKAGVARLFGANSKRACPPLAPAKGPSYLRKTGPRTPARGFGRPDTHDPHNIGRRS